VNLWRSARRKKELPSLERLKEARARSGYEGVRLDPENRCVELTKPRMRLDAGGIAKGYAMEEALNVLRGLGFPRAMVAGGGDMALGDAPEGEKGWRIEIVALDEVGAPPALPLVLTNCCVSTSGDLYQRLEIEGKRYSHIVDPRTGVGLTDHSQVTVIAKRGMEADALSKVVAVLGADAGFPIVEGMEGVVCRVVRAPGGVLEEKRSRGWEALGVSADGHH
jgi:FAD:protein FMN transferase